jgi:hypothetical protein
MKLTPDSTFKTLAVIAVLLVAAGGVVASLGTAAEKSAQETKTTTFVGTPPAAGATDGNVADFTH